MAGVGCATRKDSLPLAREIWPGGGSGGGEACRCLGGSGGGRACRRLGGRWREEQSSGRKIPADLEVFGEKDYFYKKKDAQ